MYGGIFSLLRPGAGRVPLSGGGYWVWTGRQYNELILYDFWYCT